MTISDLISSVAAQYRDTRTQVFKVQAAGLEGESLALQGSVLETANLDDLCQKIRAAYPELRIDTDGVKVLRKPGNGVLHVATNLSSLHAEPSWLAEQVSQLVFGVQLEILIEQGRWAFVRQADGYLGWAYLPFLSSQPLPEATHLVCAPVSLVHTHPEPGAALASRLLGGTAVRVSETREGWAQVQANVEGWVPVEDVRAIHSLPQAAAARRAQIVSNAFKFYGVQYLWGGCTAHGIDCSGLAQLTHRLAGITLPRDADMQMDVGKPVEFPFQPGDLLFFGEVGDQRSITHVAVSLGGWEIIHSSRSNNGVYTDNVQAVPHLKDSFVGAATFIE